MRENFQKCLMCRSSLLTRRRGTIFCCLKCNTEYRAKQFQELLGVTYNGWYEYNLARIAVSDRIYYEVTVSPFGAIRERIVSK